MSKAIFPLVLSAAFTLSLALSPAVQAGSKTADFRVPLELANNNLNADITGVKESAEALATSLYNELDLSSLGLSFEAMKYAYKGFEYLRNTGALSNNDILTVVDFSQTSRKKRMYIIDVTNREVLLNTYVAHGKNTGLDMAASFSNTHESLQSSLGFYVTKGTYFGKHGLSLKLDGKEKGINNNAESRAVVLHGAEYIGEHRKGSSYMGRSFGCPAVPQSEVEKVIRLIKNGTTLFIYHPTNSYLHGSKILNG
ncbi:MAG: murein L,D-transpeptidase catalytic domain family protein [Chitinophagaceae bacterium]